MCSRFFMGRFLLLLGRFYPIYSFTGLICRFNFFIAQS